MPMKLRTKKQFKKDLQKASSDKNKKIELLKSVINDHLLVTGTVPQQYLPHPLKGNWKPHMECHIQPDFLLIWDVDWENGEVILVRCGSHSDLFG